MLAKDWIGCSKLNTGRQGLFVGHGCSSQAASFTARLTVVKKAWGPLEHPQHLRPLQLSPQYCLASCIDAVQLEDPLGDIQTDCGNLHGGRLLQLVALNGPSLAQRCRQGSSTASDFIHWCGMTGLGSRRVRLSRNRPKLISRSTV